MSVCQDCGNDDSLPAEITDLRRQFEAMTQRAEKAEADAAFAGRGGGA